MELPSCSSEQHPSYFHPSLQAYMDHDMLSKCNDTHISWEDMVALESLTIINGAGQQEGFIQVIRDNEEYINQLQYNHIDLYHSLRFLLERGLFHNLHAYCGTALERVGHSMHSILKKYYLQNQTLPLYMYNAANILEGMYQDDNIVSGTFLSVTYPTAFHRAIHYVQSCTPSCTPPSAAAQCSTSDPLSDSIVNQIMHLQ